LWGISSDLEITKAGGIPHKQYQPIKPVDIVILPLDQFRIGKVENKRF